MENNHIAHGGAANQGSREVPWGRETPEEEDEKVPFLKEDAWPGSSVCCTYNRLLLLAAVTMVSLQTLHV